MAYLAKKLTGTAVISIQIIRGSVAARTGTVLGDAGILLVADGFKSLAVVSGRIFSYELFPAEFWERFRDDGKLIHLEFLVFGGMSIIESPLLQRDVLADE